MTLQEAISQGLITTIVGLATVFAVLIILMLVLKLFEKVFYKKDTNVQQKNAPIIEKTEADNITVAVNQPKEENEDELIAVLTAAVAASLNTSTYNLHIKSYRRIENNSPVWNRAGLRETIESRYN